MKSSETIFDFRVIIHTVQMLSDNFNFTTERFEDINNKPYIIKNNARLTKKGFLFPINANKFYDKEIGNLTGFLIAIREIQMDLNIPQWSFNRVDFAFDTKLKYDDIYKYSLYIICLVSKDMGIKNAIDIHDINTKKKRALTLKNSVFEFQIYDKYLESDNKYPYCRFEFRFKNIRDSDIYILTEKLFKIIDDLKVYIPSVEKQRVIDLYNLWIKESRIGCVTQIKDFSEFVRRYNNDIFTRHIAKNLYYKICKGNFEDWLKWFRRNNYIKFIAKGEIENLTREMEKALNLYIQNG